jgi:DNA-directed RNA polymerase specialized sigma subunit
MDTKIDKKQVKSLYHSGMNMRQVAEELGVSNSDICKFMIKYNINARSSSSQKVILDKEKVMTMYESGMSQSKIGKALGVSNVCICRFMKEHNIKVKIGRPKIGRPKKRTIKNG